MYRIRNKGKKRNVVVEDEIGVYTIKREIDIDLTVKRVGNSEISVN